MPELSIEVRRYCAFAAGVVWCALLLQAVLTTITSLDNGKGFGHAVLVYFGYFTILSNLLVASVLSAAARPGASTGFWRILQQSWLRASATAAIIIVGLLYFLILRHTWQPTGLQKLADGMLHYLAPVLTLIFWTAVCRHDRLAWRDLPRSLIYPMLYLVYVFMRGAVSGLYPYPFINVADIGLQQALANALGILAVYTALAVLLFVLNRCSRIHTA